MKKTNQTFKMIVAIAAVTTLVACKKEIEIPQVSKQIHTTLPAGPALTKHPIGYIGSSTLGDSTSVNIK
jgi:hypothetical protein